MAQIGGIVVKTIKEAILKSTGDGGLISCYEAPDGELIYFINGIPQLTILTPKKDL